MSLTDCIPGASSFRLLDGSAAPRQDLISRVEIKFPLHRPDIGKLRRILESNCRRMAYNETVSTVRSVYFDDHGLSSCYANLHGVGRRRKARVRWYDTLTPGTEFFFELKWRNNRVTGKHRFHVQAPVPLVDLPYRTLFEGMSHALPEQHRATLLSFPDPTVLVEYKREHFVSPDEALRITLDYDVVYYNQSGRQTLSTRFGEPVEHLVVIEGKAPVGRECELVALLYPLALRARRCSKYVLGCETLGLIAPGN